jgi:hypothetical protein
LGLGVLVSVIARIDQRATTQQELAHLEFIPRGCDVKRGPATLGAIVDSRARVEQQEYCVGTPV